MPPSAPGRGSRRNTPATRDHLPMTHQKLTRTKKRILPAMLLHRQIVDVIRQTTPVTLALDDFLFTTWMSHNLRTTTDT